MNNIFNRSRNNSRSPNSIYRTTPLRSNYSYRNNSPEKKGTFHVRYSSPILKNYSNKEGDRYKVQNIIFMDEYENGACLKKKRIEDYQLILNKECPDNENYRRMFQMGLRFNHLGLVADIYNQDNNKDSRNLNRGGFFNNSNSKMRNNFFQKNQNREANRGNFFNRNGREEDNGRNSDRGNVFNGINSRMNDRNSENGRDGSNSRTGFFSRGNDNNERNGRGIFGNSNRGRGNDQNNLSNSFFNSRNNSDRNRNENTGRSSFFGNRGSSENRGGSNTSFFSNNRGNSQTDNSNKNSFFTNTNRNNNDKNNNNPNTRSSFFNNNNNRNSDSNNNQNSFFNNNSNRNPNQNNSSFFNQNTNQNQTGGSFFNNNSNTTPSFSNNNQNQNPSSFFNNNNQNQNPSSFFTNNTPQQSSFFNKNNTPQQSSFFNNNNSTQQSSFFKPKNNQNPQFFNNSSNNQNNPLFQPQNPNLNINAYPYPYLMGPQNYYQNGYGFQNPNLMNYNNGFENNSGRLNVLANSSESMTRFIDEKRIENEIKIATEKEMRREFLKVEREQMYTQQLLEDMKNDREDDFRGSIGFSKRNLIENAKKNFRKNFLENSKKKKKKGDSCFSNKNTFSRVSNISTFNTGKSILNNNKLINLEIKVSFLDKERILKNIEINKLQSVKNLKNYIIKKMNKYIFTEEQIKEKSNLTFDKTILNSETRLKEIEELEKKSIHLEIDLNTIKTSINPENSLTENPNFCPEAKLPILTKIGYKISPSLTQISRMTITQIKSIQNLKIWNSHGKIEWQNSDLTEQNLDLDIHIKPREVEVYPDDLYSNLKNKPEIGSKLNRPCKITLFNMEPSEGQSKSKFVRKLERLCESQGSEFLDYDWDNRIYCFRVFHFTKYSFVDIDVADSGSEDSEVEVIEEVGSFGDCESGDDSYCEKGNAAFGSNKSGSFNGYGGEGLDRGKKDFRFEGNGAMEEEYSEEKILENKIKKKNKNKKEEELMDLLNKSQHLSFFNNKDSSQQKKDLRNEIILKKRDFDLKKNFFVTPVVDLPNFDKEENDRIEAEIKDLEDNYNNYQKKETEITANKKQINFNTIDKKVLKNFAFLNKIINNDKITKDSKHFYKTFDFPMKWIDNETVSILKKDNFKNLINEKKIKFSKKVNLNQIFLIIKNVFSEIIHNQKSNKNKQNLNSENFLDMFFITLLNQFHIREMIEPYLFILLIISIFGKNCVSFFNQKLFKKNFDERLDNLKRRKENNKKQSESEEFLKFFKKREFINWLEKVIFLTLKIEKSSFNENNIFNLFLEEDDSMNDDFNLDNNFEKLTSIYFKKLKNDYIIKNFLLFLRIEKKNNLSLADLYNKFEIQETDDNDFDFYEIILIDALKINNFIEKKLYLEKKNINSFIIGGKIINSKKELHFLNLLFHNLLIIQTPEILQNITFQNNYKWNFKMTHEILIQNKFYSPALTICSNFIIPSLINKEGYENHSLNLILNFSDLNNKQLEDIINEFYNRREIFCFKAFYNLVNLRYKEAIEDFCKINKFEKGYNIYFEQYLSPFILERKFDEIELLCILKDFEKFEFEVKKKKDSKSNLILNFLHFLDSDKKHDLFNNMENFEYLVKTIFEEIKTIFEREKNIWENHKEIFLTISSEVFKIISNCNKNDISENVLEFIKNDFVLLLRKHEILPILKEEDQNDIIQGFLFLL